MDVKLSTRQRMILEMAVTDMPQKEIASKLKIGLKTVSTHLSKIKRKAGVSGLAGLTKFAVRNHYTQL